MLITIFFINIIINNLKLYFISTYKFKVPIICVGNIFVGGTGKTPLSIYIYNLLKRKNLNLR